MRALVQRVREASVSVEGEVVGGIGPGLLVFLGCGEGDSRAELDWVVRKIAGLRVFEDHEGRMQHALSDVGGSLLVVSQFTLYGDVRRGNRPAFTGALAPGAAEALIDEAVQAWRAMGLPVQTGRFGANMQVHLINDGPVTLWVERAPHLEHP